ncbi:hypothetical protein, partial [Burkholderia sp. Cy-647]|uniref:hypothetical protein n=1 Tax=Burkholderia sp. Cy-647 TaxID=2608328 RepID=UPI0019649826
MNTIGMIFHQRRIGSVADMGLVSFGVRRRIGFVAAHPAPRGQLSRECLGGGGRCRPGGTRV